MTKDWTGNKATTFAVLGASNHSSLTREVNDYYATDPKAVELLLEKEKFSSRVLEPSCGEGHISKSLQGEGYQVESHDLVDRGFGTVKDFFTVEKFDGDIITNPPYKIALDFVKHSLEIIPDGNKVAMFLKIQFLESKSRRIFFDEFPPKKIYVASSRLICAMNGEFDKYKSSAACYAWFVLEKGYLGKPEIDWIN